MEETIAELRRQLEEERQAREEAERHVQPNTLFTLLDRCHNYLSQAIRVETDATLTTQGDATNPDVQADDELRLHRTAIGQVLAFTLQALAAKAPSQEWHDAAYDKLETWDVEYLDVLRKIPETLRKDPRASNYRPSHWKLEPKTHNTRSRARCKPDISTPKHSSTEGSGSDEESHSPSIAAAARSGSSRGRGNNRQSTKESESKRAGQNNKQTSRKDGQSTRPYCTIACIRGIVNREPLDQECPNWKLHGGQRHSIGPQEFTRRLHRQLTQTETMGLNSFTSVVGQVTSSKLPFYHTGTLWSLKLPQWRSSIAFKRRRTLSSPQELTRKSNPRLSWHIYAKSYIGTMAN
ncbi:hypothetical protein PDIDSM_8192 [Penicillium digitatum]|nr:hypothetical protein PDIDSM_8192 [Penicillium digitatum]